MKVEIQALGDRPWMKRILVDGQDISSAVRGVILKSRVDELDTVLLELHVVEGTGMESGDARVMIPPQTHDALVALGWTPPGQGVTVPRYMVCNCGAGDEPNLAHEAGCPARGDLPSEDEQELGRG
jgi:hypothetical protein